MNLVPLNLNFSSLLNVGKSHLIFNYDKSSYHSSSAYNKYYLTGSRIWLCTEIPREIFEILTWIAATTRNSDLLYLGAAWHWDFFFFF